MGEACRNAESFTPPTLPNAVKKPAPSVNSASKRAATQARVADMMQRNEQTATNIRETQQDIEQKLAHARTAIDSSLVQVAAILGDPNAKADLQARLAKAPDQNPPPARRGGRGVPVRFKMGADHKQRCGVKRGAREGRHRSCS